MISGCMVEAMVVSVRAFGGLGGFKHVYRLKVCHPEHLVSKAWSVEGTCLSSSRLLAKSRMRLITLGLLNHVGFATGPGWMEIVGEWHLA